MSSTASKRAWEESTTYPGGPLLPTGGGNPSALTMTSCSPSTGVAAGGTAVTLTGTNFYKVKRLLLGGKHIQAFTRVSATSITFTTPSNTTGAKSLVLEQHDNTIVTLASAFTYT